MKLSALLALFLAGSACAQGTMSGLYDSKTGLSWLALTATTNVAENQVSSLYPAWTIASADQVMQLWNDCGFGPRGGLFSTGYLTNQWHPLNKFMDAMGVTSWQGQYPESLGHVQGGTVAAIDFLWNNGVPEYAVYCGGLWHNPDVAFPTTGTYMYQIIPEPTVLGLGLVALLAFNYRKP